LVVAVVLVCSSLGTVWGSRSCCFGDLWLSWSPDVREAYVGGFILGFRRGGWKVCRDSFFGKPSSGAGTTKKNPYWACQDRVPQFSHMEDKFYADAITAFYKKYSADRWLFPWEVLLDMAEPPGLSIDQIHAQIDKRHHP
jgi:hypothetical protein